MSCHHSGRWYFIENRFKRPRPRGMLADGWPRMKWPVWLVGSGCPTWQGYRRVRAEDKSGTGRLWFRIFCVFVFEAVEARSSCSHLLPTAAHRQISTLHISKKKDMDILHKRWRTEREFGQWRLVLGRLVGHHLGREDCLRAGIYLEMMLRC